MSSIKRNLELNSKSKRPKPDAKVQKAHELAKKARQKSYSPYSNFKVGAVLISRKTKQSKRNLTAGCNVENASYGGTVCAERTAIFKAVSEGEKSFTDIVVVTDAEVPAFPCALCLQVMAEFFDPGTKIWVANTNRIHAVHSFAELLPKPFGPRQLAQASDEQSAKRALKKNI